jgi:hypothetical protein
VKSGLEMPVKKSETLPTQQKGKQIQGTQAKSCEKHAIFINDGIFSIASTKRNMYRIHIYFLCNKY